MTTLTRGDQITALVLAGGRGMRMGGVNKGLQPFRGQPLACAALDRLAAQTLRPEHIAISANCNLGCYVALGKAFGAPVWPDDEGDHSLGAGPLAGVLTGLRHATTPYLLTVPCDVPFLPLSLCERLVRALQGAPKTSLAVVRAPDGEGGSARLQPLFCLLRRDAGEVLVNDLAAGLCAGDYKASDWIARQRHVIVSFDAPGGAILPPFANANTRSQLRRLDGMASGANPDARHETA